MNGYVLVLMTCDDNLPVGLYPDYDTARVVAQVHGMPEYFDDANATLKLAEKVQGFGAGGEVCGWSITQFVDGSPVKSWDWAYGNADFRPYTPA